MGKKSNPKAGSKRTGKGDHARKSSPRSAGAGNDSAAAITVWASPLRWFRSRNPIFRFVASLAVLMIVANVLLSTSYAKKDLLPSYLRGWAHISAGALKLMGERTTVSDSQVISPRFSVSIKRGCDAVQPTLLFVTAVIASPVALWSKLPGLAFGLLFLMAMNLVRVISLFYIGIYFSMKTFDIMHHDVWQAVFIILSIFAWAVWAVWAVRKTVVGQHARA